MYVVFLHDFFIRMAFPLVLPMPEISSDMGMPDESRAVHWRAFGNMTEFVISYVVVAYSDSICLNSLIWTLTV
jgi:hypothetical protein